MTFFHSVWRGLTMARNVAANLLFLLILIIVLMAVFGGRGGSGLPAQFALELDVAGIVVERATPLDPLNRILGRGAQQETVLGDLERALASAAKDERVGAVVLNTHELQYADMVQIARIADGVKALKAAGKPVLANGYYLTQPQYLLASYADALYLHPMGEALLTGLASYQPYFAELLNKLSIDVHVFRVGKYKSAVEPYLLDSMSPEAAAASTELLDQLWSSFRNQVASNRGLEPAAIDAFIHGLPDALVAADGDVARLAVESRLVDELLTPDAFHARIAQELDVEPDDLERVDTQSYLASLGPQIQPADSGKAVGLISAVGAITGSANGQLAAGIIAEEVTALIREAKEDDSVRALVVHVDSPGGEVLASELIRHELELVQLAGKPVVVSMAGTAASGGYWISATADKILASAETITGSIGIFGLLPTIDKVLAKAGVTIDGVATHELAGGLNLSRPLSPAMSRIVQSSVNQGYDRFIALVARGRDLERAHVEEIAQGRVWTGTQALELGLVDQLGNLEDALDAAAELANLGADYAIERIEAPLTPQQMLLQQLSGSAHLGLQAIGLNPDSHLLEQGLQRLPGGGPLELLVRAATSSSGKQILAVCERCEVQW